MLDFFFFNDTATTEIYTLSLHDALPISARATTTTTRASPPATAPRTRASASPRTPRPSSASCASCPTASARCSGCRSEEHTSELQSRQYLVCRLLLEKKNN